MRTILTIILLLLCGNAWGAAITTAGSGDWNSTTPNAPWPGGTVPDPSTDTITIASGHTVALTDSRTIPATTIKGRLNMGAGLSIALNGELIISNSGGTGYLSIAEGVLLNAGTNNILMNQTTVGTATWDINGTAQSPVTITGTTGRIYYTSASGAGRYYFRYAVFDGFTHASGNTLNAYTSLDISNCMFKNGTKWTFGAINVPAGTTYKVNNSDFRNLTAMTGKIVEFIATNNATHTGPFEISGNTFVGSATAAQSVYTTMSRGFTANNNILYDCYWDSNSSFGNFDGCAAFYSSTSGPASQIQWNLGAGNSTWQNGIIASYAENSHGLYGGAQTSQGAVSILNSVFETYWTGGASSTPDPIIPSKLSATTISGNIILGISSGILSALDTGSTAAATITNNTFAHNGISTHDGGRSLSYEFGGYRTGNVKFSSNFMLDMDATSSANTTAWASGTTTAAELDEANYNAGYSTDGQPRYYNFNNGASLGANDIANINPQFVDSSRRISNYRGASSMTAYFDKAVAQNGFDKTGAATTYDSTYSPATLITWVRAGFTPQNATLATSGEGGTYIGAVQPVAATSPTTTPRHSFGLGFGFEF